MRLVFHDVPCFGSSQKSQSLESPHFLSKFFRKFSSENWQYLLYMWHLILFLLLSPLALQPFLHQLLLASFLPHFPLLPSKSMWYELTFLAAHTNWRLQSFQGIFHTALWCMVNFWNCTHPIQPKLMAQKGGHLLIPV